MCIFSTTLYIMCRPCVTSRLGIICSTSIHNVLYLLKFKNICVFFAYYYMHFEYRVYSLQCMYTYMVDFIFIINNL